MRKPPFRAARRLRSLLLATAMCATAALAQTDAMKLDYFRWQFGEFAAFLRYFEHGIATPGITDIYARESAGFVPARDVAIATLCPEQTGGTLDGSWIFFGARILPLPNMRPRKPSFYTVSYLGANEGFHRGKNYDALVTAADIEAAVAGKGACAVQRKASVADRYLTRHPVGALTHGGHYAPLSWNALDVDGDGLDDFIFGGLLHLSRTGFRALEDGGAGSFAILVRTASGPRLLRLRDRTIEFASYRDDRLHIEHRHILDADVTDNAGYALLAVPGPTPGDDYVGLRQACGLALYDANRFAQAGKVEPDKCMTGIRGRWAMTGARGDFDGDGVQDFWLSLPMLGDDMRDSPDRLLLISGKRLRDARGDVAIDRLTLASIRGSRRYSDLDGIATTLSPVAGDLDADGKPDLTFTGHRHMNEAGALYVLRGKDLVPGAEFALEDRRIVKVMGPVMSQLAPPYHHWDATDWDGDGHDDIVVTADNDLHAGLNAGAVYVLSGRKLLAHPRAR